MTCNCWYLAGSTISPVSASGSRPHFSSSWHGHSRQGLTAAMAARGYHGSVESMAVLSPRTLVVTPAGRERRSWH